MNKYSCRLETRTCLLLHAQVGEFGTYVGTVNTTSVA